MENVTISTWYEIVAVEFDVITFVIRSIKIFAGNSEKWREKEKKNGIYWLKLVLLYQRLSVAFYDDAGECSPENVGIKFELERSIEYKI